MDCNSIPALGDDFEFDFSRTIVFEVLIPLFGALTVSLPSSTSMVISWNTMMPPNDGVACGSSLRAGYAPKSSVESSDLVRLTLAGGQRLMVEVDLDCAEPGDGSHRPLSAADTDFAFCRAHTKAWDRPNGHMLDESPVVLSWDPWRWSVVLGICPNSR
jgi:hypothetical protein